MHSMRLMFFFIVSSVCSLTAQPTFFKSTFKGLGDIVSNPSAPSNDEIRVVFYHEQTVAVINLGPSNELRDCNIIEVYEPSEATEVLRNLSMILQPQVVSFQEITRLMQQCELLDKLQVKATSALPMNALSRAASSITLFSGILPGTKWCGTGDIAENYHDLGDLPHIDRCCRTHDLCPIKVRAQQTRYNLTNYSLYTKSHCTCDKTLYQCLKAANHPTANLMGQIYFNIIKVPCIEDTKKNRYSSSSRKFVPVKKEY
ncbi:phospholipase A2 phaiodactylipin-like isoform X1 [Cataglyphis hispanica]|uniref:phospholipase A2 phaiodactylipin-like isoform X1 n=1 Tax=Cataglyphis hispanica TaxID=1086592 RepID=UPI00218045D6|nr:phospholipase A2 phaiodactylipin-like isoform X1 [Cataglyphis hispanica]XP_050451691.1 phospholipase A2 phaiodactylipin-like isoform X1 [Cataglyphis hispanica]